MTNTAPSTTLTGRTGRSSLLELALGAIREQRAVLWAALPFIAGSYVVGPFVGWPGAVGASFWIAQATFMGMIAVFWVVVRHRFAADLKPQGARAAYPVAWRRAREATFTNERLAAYAVMLIVLPTVVACYTGWKTWLAATLPFRWDPTLMRLDRALHFGTDPWRLLQPLLGREWTTDVMSLVYESGWAATLHGVITWQALRPPSADRNRFLVASVLAWPLVGNLLAAAFMSAGPCYYGFVVAGANPYAELLAHVNATNDLTRALQGYLWRSHASGDLEVIGGGISAMPSMHLMMVTLAAIPLWRLGRRGRVLAAAVVFSTVVGSVHLGWHYAVDGYAGILSAVSIWWLLGPLFRRATPAHGRTGTIQRVSSPPRAGPANA